MITNKFGQTNATHDHNHEDVRPDRLKHSFWRGELFGHVANTRRTKDGEEIRTLLCQHVFHKECIDTWLGRKSECPVCRTPLRATSTQVQRATGDRGSQTESTAMQEGNVTLFGAIAIEEVSPVLEDDATPTGDENNEPTNEASVEVKTETELRTSSSRDEAVEANSCVQLVVNSNLQGTVDAPEAPTGWVETEK